MDLLFPKQLQPSVGLVALVILFLFPPIYRRLNIRSWFDCLCRSGLIPASGCRARATVVDAARFCFQPR
jgi:hypothetical protein